MPPEGIAKLKHEFILTYEEILRLAGIAANLGVHKIRLTGGEPLLRKGLYEFIPKLAAIPGLKDLSLTTNGVYLKENLEKIGSSGIRRINVSLDTLRPERFRKITGYDAFQEVWEGIDLAKKLGFEPIKINVVVVKGLNDDEILDLAKLSLEHPYHIRFIEYMPVDCGNPNVSLDYVPNSLIKAQIETLGRLNRVQEGTFDGPAERFKFEGAPGEIGFISPLTAHFCRVCNRLRLTASGHLRPCLLSNQEEDLKGPMRQGASDDDLEKIFLKATFKKPYTHHLISKNPTPFSASMSSIGG